MTWPRGCDNNDRGCGTTWHDDRDTTQPSERNHLFHNSGTVFLSLSLSDDTCNAPRSGLLCTPHVAREHKLHRVGVATTGVRASVHLRLAELGVGCCKEYVCCHQHKLHRLRVSHMHINQ